MNRTTSFTGLSLAAAAMSVALYAAVALAQQAASPPASPASEASGTSPAPAGEGGQKPGAGKSRSADDKSDPQSLPPPADSSKPTPQRFEPTEKVRPDFDVAFPVDI